MGGFEGKTARIFAGELPAEIRSGRGYALHGQVRQPIIPAIDLALAARPA